MVEQYLHYLYVERSTGAYRLANGDFHPGVIEWHLHSRCREETNGEGEEIQLADMTSRKFSSLVQLPKGTAYIPDGNRVLVSNIPLDDLRTETIKEWTRNGTIRIVGDVLKFDIGQLHCRLWL